MPKTLTALKYHARKENRMISAMNMLRTSLNVNPSSLVPAVSLVTPFHEVRINRCSWQKHRGKRRSAQRPNRRQNGRQRGYINKMSEFLASFRSERITCTE